MTINSTERLYDQQTVQMTQARAHQSHCDRNIFIHIIPTHPHIHPHSPGIYSRTEQSQQHPSGSGSQTLRFSCLNLTYYR